MNSVKDYKAAWQGPFSKRAWKGFLQHDFANDTRAIAAGIIEKFLLSAEGETQKFVEIGFGQGLDFSKHFKQMHDQELIEYAGYDVTEQFVSYAKEEWPGYDFRDGGFPELKKDSCDISYARHVFEHQHPHLYKLFLRNMLLATRKLCIISWFVRPEVQKLSWQPRGGFGGAGAWVNAYSKKAILEIVEADWDIEIQDFARGNALYIMRRKQ